MREFFLYGKANNEQLDFLHKVLDLGLDFIEGTVRDGLTFKYLNISELKSLFKGPMPTESSTFDDLYKEIKKIAEYSIPQCDQRYLAFPDTGNSVATIAADIIRACLNQNLIAVDRSAPVATFIEAQLILWLRELVGYPSFKIEDLPNLNSLGGMWTSGGNMSNYIAVHTALRHKFPQIKVNGIVSLKKRPIMILAKGMEHYSFLAAAQALGLGSKGILWAETNEDFTTNTDSIISLLDNLPDGVEPFMIVAVAGNCRTSDIDNIKKIREISSYYGLWFHVDACHGGSLLFSKRLRKLIEGIELSDSVSLDPHKGLFVTYSSSYILFRDPSCLGDYCRYTEKVYDSKCFDLGLITPFFGSRGFESLKLWLLIKHMGLKGLEKAIEGRESTYLKLVNMLKQTDYFIFLNDPKFYRLAFVFCPNNIKCLVKGCIDKKIDIKLIQDIINKYTKTFCDKLYRAGKVVFDLFVLQDFGNRIGLGKSEKYEVMGMSVGHPFIEDTVLRQIQKEIYRIGEQCREAMQHDFNLLKRDCYEKQHDVLFVGKSPASW